MLGSTAFAHGLDQSVTYEDRYVGAREAVRAARDRLQVSLLQGVWRCAERDAEQCESCRLVWQRNVDAPLEAPAHSGVEPPWNVRRPEHEDALSGGRHAHEHLVLETARCVTLRV